MSFLTLLLLASLTILLSLVAAYVWKFTTALASRTQTFSRKHTTALVDFPIGPYRLGGATDLLAGLTEFSQGQYALMGRVFEGERNYNAPTIEFLSCSWKVMLGTVSDRIYKIAIYLEEFSREEAGRIAKDTFDYCYGKLGEPSEHKIEEGFPWGTGFFVWNATDGNAILQTVEVDASFAINFYVTSWSTKDFKRLTSPATHIREFVKAMLWPWKSWGELLACMFGAFVGVYLFRFAGGFAFTMGMVGGMSGIVLVKVARLVRRRTLSRGHSS